MRKPALRICKNKGADQLHGNPLLRVSTCTITLIRNFKTLAILCGCTARFVSNLVGKPGVFSRNADTSMVTSGMCWLINRNNYFISFLKFWPDSLFLSISLTV